MPGAVVEARSLVSLSRSSQQAPSSGKRWRVPAGTPGNNGQHRNRLPMPRRRRPTVLRPGVTEGTRTPDLQGHNLCQFTGDGRLRRVTSGDGLPGSRLGSRSASLDRQHRRGRRCAVGGPRVRVTQSRLRTAGRPACTARWRSFGHSLSKVKQTRYGTCGSWLCAWAYLPSRDVAIDEAPRAGGDECAGVGDGTSGRGPQRGVGALAGPPGDDAERTAW